MDLLKEGNPCSAWLVGVSILLSTTLAITPAYATTIQFTGTLGVVEIDNGSSTYSGLTVGDTFSGSITYGDSASDAIVVDIEPTYAEYKFEGTPYGGFITGGSITTAGSGSHLMIGDDHLMLDEAAFLNNLFGSGSTTADTIADSWGADSFGENGSGNGQYSGVILYSLNTSLYPVLDFQVLPPSLADSDFPIFLIGEVDGDDDDMYLATGILTSITVVPDFTIGCGTLLTADTTLDSDMVCASNALILSGAGSNDVTLNCAGFSVTNTGTNFPAIAANNVSGVVIRNCNINTLGSQAYGISMSNVSSSEISDNIITTDKTFSHGINMSQSSNNLIDGNTISTTGLSARGIQIQRLSSFNTLSENSVTSARSRGVRLRAGSNNNTFSQNSIESGTSSAFQIESASSNQLTGNTLIALSGSFLRLGSHVIQNGGLSVGPAGNIFAVENNFGSNGGSGGSVATLVQVDSNTGDPLSYVRLVSGGFDLGFGFDSLEIMPDGRFLAGRAGNQNSLYEINPVSGEVSLLPTIASINGFNGLQSTGANTLLATTNQGELLSIDLVTNTGTLLGQDGVGWTDLALHPTSGKLFAVSRWSKEPSGTSHLYEIDPATGFIIQEIGDTGQSIVSDIDFSASGVLYGNNGLLVIDTAIGAGTYVGGFGPDPFESLSQNNTLTNQTFSATSASVQFSQPINLPAVVDLRLDANAIQLEQNRVFIESAIFPFLDEPARITLENLAGTERSLLVDAEDDGTFVACDSQCTPVSFTGGTLIFDVDGFTTYSSVAGSGAGASIDIVVDFGAIALWAWMNDSNWQKLANDSPTQIVTGDIDGNDEDDVIAVFGSGIFINRNLGGWAQLHNSIPDVMAVGDLDNNGQDDVVIDFGAIIGLYARMNDTNWLKLSNDSPTQIIMADIDGTGKDDVIAVFGSGIFINYDLEGWIQLHNSIPDSMAVGDLDNNGQDDLVVDFDAVIGLYAWMNGTEWLKLYNGDPDLIATGDIDGNGADDVVATFGSSVGGTWQMLNLGGWSELSGNAADEIVTGDVDASGQDDVIADFGSTIGGLFVKRNQGGWEQLHNTSPEALATGQLDGN